MKDMVNVSICDGKYTIVQDASGRTNVLRYGESWRDATGDNVILGAAYEIEKLQARIKRLEEAGQIVEDAAHSVQDWSGTALGDALDELNKAKEAKP